MDPQSNVQKYGGKAGGWFFLRDFGGFEENLPKMLVYLPANESFSTVADQFTEESFNAMIVRATHPNDHRGLVDVLTTKRGLFLRQDLEKAVTEIRENANLQEVFDYSKYEGQLYDGNIGIMIQPQTVGIRGSVVEHPHEKGTLIIEYVDFKSYGDKEINRAIAKGNEIEDLTFFCKKPEVSQKVVDLYRRVKETKFISSEYSFQMEFGIPRGDSKVLSYQARPFLKFETPTFELEGYEEYQCFGITPKEGIVLPVIKTNSLTSPKTITTVNEVEDPFAWVVEPLTDSLPLTCQPKNLKVFLPNGARVDSLEHNVYRWLRKAEVSIFSPDYGAFLDSLRDGDQLKIKSNGLYFELKKI